MQLSQAEIDAVLLAAGTALAVVILILALAQRPRLFVIDIDPGARSIRIARLREKTEGEQAFYDKRGRAYIIRIRGLPAAIDSSVRVHRELLSEYALGRIFRGLRQQGQAAKAQALGFILVGLVLGGLAGAMLVQVTVVSSLQDQLLDTTAQMERFKANYLNCIKQDTLVTNETVGDTGGGGQSG